MYLDGKYTKLIFNGNARSIAITSQGDILIGEYDYTGASESTGIYRLTQEEKIKIRDDEAMWLAVCNDQIYFKSMTRGMEIMRCDINGENGVYVAETREAQCFPDAAVMFLIHNILWSPILGRRAGKSHSSRAGKGRT